MRDPGRPDRKGIHSAEVGIPHSADAAREPAGGARQRGPDSGAFTEGPNEAIAEFRGRGDARVHEKNREIASAVQEKKEMGHRRSYREQQPRWWC